MCEASPGQSGLSEMSAGGADNRDRPSLMPAQSDTQRATSRAI
jgi:hypothetical protein